MDTAQKSMEPSTRRSSSKSGLLTGVALAGVIVGIAVGLVIASAGSVSAPSDPAQIVASVVDDLNTAYVYGDTEAINAIFGDYLAFNPGQGRDLVGPAGAAFFNERAGTGAVARRITEPVENSDGTYMFVMEVYPPNQLKPLVFENHATVEDGRLVRIEQGDRILPDPEDG